jgi:serine O-acetyltransferase
VILGGVILGDDCCIGANAVVLCDVPVGYTAVGIPAKLIPPKEPQESLKSIQDDVAAALLAALPAQ